MIKLYIKAIICLLMLIHAGNAISQSRKLTRENIDRSLDTLSIKTKQDPLFPGFHLTPPGGCMGDPNGGLYLDGWYHIFYGLQPFSSNPGGWYWAHARSRDLLHWEHMENNLTPAFELGINAVGSGSTIITDKGDALAFYSSSNDGNMKFWRAQFNKDLTAWSHEGENPVLTLDHPGLPNFDKFWRDPFVFEAGGKTYLIACADLLEENHVSVPIFEAMNEDLTTWKYRGIMFTYPKHKLRNLEVPELRPLGDKWILLASADAPVDMVYSFVGDFDLHTLKFTPNWEGPIDYSGHYYAQESITDDEGDIYLMAWIPGWDRPFLPNFREHDLKNDSKIANGCFAIPRLLSLSDEGGLIQQPVASMKALRTEHISLGRRELPVDGPYTGVDVLSDVRGNQMEIMAEFDLHTASFCGLNVLCDEEGNGGLYIMWSGDFITVDGIRIPVKEWEQGTNLNLQIFVDKQYIEVFINGGKYCVSRKLREEYIKGDYVALTSLGGRAILQSLDAWKLKTIN